MQTSWFGRRPGIRHGNSGWQEAAKSRAPAGGWRKDLNCSNVIFLGHLSAAQLGEEMRGARIFFFPSEVEGHPQVLGQAAACGLPCVARSSYHPDYVVDGTTGLLASSDEQMSEALNRLIREPDLRVQMSSAAIKHAEQFDWDGITEQWQEIMELAVAAITRLNESESRESHEAGVASFQDSRVERMKQRIAILTEIISPYRIPVFNALAKHEGIDLQVIFLSETDPTLRQWRVYKDEIHFAYEVLPSWRLRAGGSHLLLNAGLAASLKRFSPGAIICGGYNYVASWQGLRWARRARVRFILWSESNAGDARGEHEPG